MQGYFDIHVNVCQGKKVNIHPQLFALFSGILQKDLKADFCS